MSIKHLDEARYRNAEIRFRKRGWVWPLLKAIVLIGFGLQLGLWWGMWANARVVYETEECAP